ncbi:MAG: hypothetical protein A2Z03_08525 [Chloroflexi bacterium RBG_16_56_8]|nr:MAG: hypothetical protein A2Z03_08525 [Chloroflexi bacterium RBG_16_56_8]
MLQEHGENNRELTRRYLGQMQNEIGYLQRLVDHLLALASVEGSDTQRAAVMEAIDLTGLLTETADEMQIVAQESGLTLDVKLADHLPPVNANREQMSILVRNLLDNACKYARRGGTITLAARVADQAIEICVTDTGVGIPADALPHIFERFYRADPARSRGGSGAGLACRWYMRL